MQNTWQLREQQYANAANFNARIYLYSKFKKNPYPWPAWLFDQIEKPDYGRVLELVAGPDCYGRLTPNGSLPPGRSCSPIINYSSLTTVKTMVSNFSLENGADQLQKYFPRLEMRRYEDSLIITEVDALFL